MPSKKPGKATLKSNCFINITPFGLWILLNDEEYFLDFENFPWFKEARVDAVQNFEFSHGHHLYWPDLDVDLSLDVIRDPSKFPLISQPK